MTTEEIKEQIPMSSILDRYGIKIRNNMCSCPFHGKDKHPSMKVYKNGVFCFTCNYSADQIKFVQDYEHCDFKTAFYSLGGEYEHHKDVKAEALAKASLERKKRERERKQQNEIILRQSINFALELISLADQIYEVYSDDWCFLKDQEPYLLECFEELYLGGKEVNEVNVYRKCESIRRRILAI